MRARLCIVLLPVLALLGAPGCASSVKSSQMRVISAPPATVREIAIEVDTQAAGTEREQAALRTGLRDAFAALGYQVESGDLVLKATITKLHLGDTAANVTHGLGIGKDTIDVSVALSDSTGAPCVTFLVHGAAIDKRYSDLDGVIRDVAKKIAEEVKRASKYEEGTVPETETLGNAARAGWSLPLRSGPAPRAEGVDGHDLPEKEGVRLSVQT